MSAFKGLRVSITDVIKGILDSYPAGAAVLRELLQNSDDAKATKQIFLLDRRSYHLPIDFSFKPAALEKCQGPALLAINDSVFEDKDWVAIGNIHQSSKKADETTTGKFGLGFQACYHITDNPQIYSGGSLVILDPHLEFSDNGGVTFTSGHSLDPFVSTTQTGGSTGNTVIRLPLRSSTHAETSKIKQQPISPDKVKEWFNDFITTELKVGLLFLKHITSIELQEVDEDGAIKLISSVGIINMDEDIRSSRSRNRGRTEEQGSYVLDIETLINGTYTSCTWVVAQFVDDYTKVERDMSTRLGYPVKDQMKIDKLLPHVALAIPVSESTVIHCDGKLFTLLPLPVATKFPLHIHSIFALTSDRQRLRNAQEKVDNKSREQLLIEWNRYIFNSIVPQAWTHLLQTLVASKPDINIYSAWPSVLSLSNLGDEAYWANLPTNLLRIAGSRPIWPMAKGGYFTLTNVMLSDESKNEDSLMKALLEANVPISLVPHHLFQLVALPPGTYRSKLLSATTVSSFLKMRIPYLERLRKNERGVIADYIASAENLQLFANLPLFEEVSGSLVAVSLARTTILANKEEAELFKSQNPNMLALESLPPAAQRLILRSKLFIRVSDSHIADYLLDFHASTFSGSSSPITIDWLCRLWRYLSTRTQVQRLMRMLSEYQLLPDHNGILHKVSHRVLDPSIASTPKGKVVEKFDVPFLHPSIGGDAKRTMNSYGMIATLDDVAFLLDQMANSSIPSLDPTSARWLHDHLESHLANVRLTEAQRASLRRLPVFPVAPSGRRERALDDNFSSASVKCYFVDASVAVIPSIKEALFFDASQSRNLMAALMAGPSLSEIDVLKLILDEKVWWNQPCPIAAGLLDRIANRFSDLYDDVAAREKLRQLPFVDVGAGKRRAPHEVVDPKADIADLFDENDGVLPVSFNERLLQRLRENGMIKQSLTREIIEDRLRSRRPGRSIRLVQLVDDYFYRSGRGAAEILPPQFTTSDWLFASRGFHAPANCRDRPSEATVRLYDLVLPMIDYAIRSEALRRVFGWGNVDPATLSMQLKRAIELSPSDAGLRLEAVIQELARTTVGWDREDLQHFLAGRAWVPTTEGLKSGRYCILDDIDFGTLSGFTRVPSKLRGNNQIKRFLTEFGVHPRPSKLALLESIEQLELKVGPDNSTLVIKCAIALLTEITTHQLEQDEWNRIRIPVQGTFCGIVQFEAINGICYDNSNTMMDNTWCGALFAHSSISKDLADKLRLERWTDKEFGDVDDAAFSSFDVHEELTTRIKNLLNRGYTINRSCNEWVANAADAGASSVAFYLNDFPFKVRAAPSPSLATYFEGPTLVVHNTSVFSEVDFEGLRSVGLGGKANRPEAIGRFGLGVLSFYHFGDLIMLISGACVVFLDPSEQHLPRKSLHQGGGKRAGLKMTLTDCWSRYPDLFSAAEGIDGFDPSKGRYDGTIFIIPLRTSQHILSSKISDKPCTTAEVQGPIFQAFFDQAEKSLFFSQLVEIKAFHRRAREDLHLIWSVQSERGVKEISKEGLTCQYITMDTCTSGNRSQSRWLTASFSTPLLDDYQCLARTHRLPDPVNVSLAIQITRHPLPSHSMFAHLPLPIQTDLPAHLDGRWILSDDRRNIRLESANEHHPGLDASFNKWLLSEVVPPLLLHGIAVASQDQEGRTLAQAIWPRPMLSLLSDQLIAQGLYKHFPASGELVCRVKGDGSRDLMLSPQDAIFGVHGNHSVHRLLSRLLPNFVILPALFDISSVDWKELKTDTHEFVRSTIFNCASEILNDPSILGDRSIKLDDIVSYLVSGSQSIVDLPLVRLHNGNLSLFRSTDRPSIFAFNEDLASLFGPEKLLEQGVLSEDTITAVIETGTVNLRKVSNESVRELLKDGHLGIVHCDTMIPPQYELAKNWLDVFWGDSRRLRKLGIDSELSTLLDLPLLPTTDGHLISLSSCEAKAPFWKSAADEESGTIITFLSDHGATVIDLPRHIALYGVSIADTVDLPRVLKILTSMNTSTDFATMTRSPRWSMLARWIRSNISNFILSTLLKQYPILNNLPIWEARQPGQSSPLVLRALTEVMMLPYGINLTDVQRYMGSRNGDWYAEYSYQLDGFFTPSNQWRRLSSTEVFDRLEWPTAIIPEEIDPYRRLVDLMRSSDPNALRNKLIFPNGVLQLCKAGSLYDEGVPLYRVAFTHQPGRFLHPQFGDLMTWSSTLGLITTITAEGFMTAVTAIDAAVREGLQLPMDRIGVAFTILNQNPWLFDEAHRGDFWDRLQGLCFVVHRGLRSPHPVFEGSVVHLEQIVSLDQLVTSEFSSVAWTQRARFFEEPSTDLKFVFGELGKPSVEEVVDHLIALAFMAQADRVNAPALLADIKATYRWLDERGDTVRPYFTSHRDEPLFINHEGDKPDLQTCQWHSARIMWLNVTWDDEANSVYSVKGFLLPFVKLLDAAGVRPYPNAIYQAPVTSTAAHSETMQSKIFELYEQDKWTDVVLVLDDGTRLKAHRLMLAAASCYFTELFAGSFKEAFIQATAENPVQVPVPDHASGEVRLALQYVYTGAFDLPTCNESKALRLLMKLLDLSNLWGVQALKHMTEKAVVDLKLVTPSTVEDIIKWCEGAGADELRNACLKVQEEAGKIGWRATSES